MWAPSPMISQGPPGRVRTRMQPTWGLGEARPVVWGARLSACRMNPSSWESGGPDCINSRIPGLMKSLYKCYNLGHARASHDDSAGGGTVAWGELCDRKTMDSEWEAEDGADPGRASSFAGV